MIKRIILALGLITLVSAPAQAQQVDFGSLNVGPGAFSGTVGTDFGTFSGGVNQGGAFGSANTGFGTFTGNSTGNFSGTVFGPGGGVNVTNSGATGWWNTGAGTVSGSTTFGGGFNGNFNGGLGSGFGGGGAGDVSKSGGTGEIGASHDNLRSGEGIAGEGPNAQGISQTVQGQFSNMLGASNQTGTNQWTSTNAGVNNVTMDDFMRLGDHPNPMSVLQVNPMQPQSVFQGQRVGTQGLAPVFGW